MNHNDYAIEFSVDQPPAKVLAAIGDVGAYWAPRGNLVDATIDGDAAEQGEEFVYRDRGIEHCRFRVSEIVPEQRAVWQVLVSGSRFGVTWGSSPSAPDDCLALCT